MVDLHRLRVELTAAATHPAPERVRRICEVSVASVPVAGAAVSVMADANRRDILYASDVHATELEELQFGLGEGPCVAAFGSGCPVLVADLDGVPDPRWPLFAAAARARTPARAAYAFPLQIGAIAIGILDLYRVEPGLLDRSELAAALLVADAALWSMLDLRAGPDDPGPDAGDDGAGDGAGGWPLVLHRGHAVVYQATGMVIAQAGVSTEAALAMLRAYAFAHDQALQEVATEVVARRLSLAGDPPGATAHKEDTRRCRDKEAPTRSGARGSTNRERVMDDQRERALTEAFVDLADTLVADYDVIDLLCRLAESCVGLLGVDAAGLLLSDQRGRLEPVAASTERTRLLELFQLQTDEGPCLDCFRSGAPVTCRPKGSSPPRRHRHRPGLHPAPRACPASPASADRPGPRRGHRRRRQRPAAPRRGPDHPALSRDPVEPIAVLSGRAGRMPGAAR